MIKIIDCNPLVLPVHSELYRIPPRPQDKMEDGYLTKYDGHTLAVDAFNAGPNVRLIGPPLLNLNEFMSDARIILDGYGSANFSWQDYHKMSRAKVEKTGSVQNLRLEIGRETLDVPVAGDDLSSFQGSNVLITMNKNNRLENIYDWALNFAKNHDVDSMIIYENRSHYYSLEEMADYLASLPLKKIYLVDWPFKFGSTGGPNQIWDSDFGIYMCWEHARWRFLQFANSVFINDADEFPVSKSGDSLVNLVENSSNGVIRYPVRNVPAAPRPGLDERRVRLHSDYIYNNRQFTNFSNKVAYQPTRLPEKVQVGNHNFYGWEKETDTVDDVVAHHFIGVHYNWRDGDWSYSSAERAPLKEHEEVDTTLAEALKTTFPDRFQDDV